MLERRLAERSLSSPSEAAAAAARGGTSQPRRSIHLASAEAASTRLSRPRERVLASLPWPAGAAAAWPLWILGGAEAGALETASPVLLLLLLLLLLPPPPPPLLLLARPPLPPPAAAAAPLEDDDDQTTRGTASPAASVASALADHAWTHADSWETRARVMVLWAATARRASGVSTASAPAATKLSFFCLFFPRVFSSFISRSESR
jgi:hypothetical protein